MTDPTRRRLLKAAALAPLAILCGARVRAGGSAAAVEATFTPDPEHPGRVVDAGLASLSYETSELVNPAFFSARNTSLVKLFRELNPHGILRIGGNTSDWTTWSGYHGKLPVERHTRYGTPTKMFVLHPEALHELAGFLEATGWRLVFGVNLRIEVPAMGLALAKAVRRIVGKHLLAIQIGNEANNYEPDYRAFDADWKTYAEVIGPTGIPLAGPDTGANTDWVEAYAREHGAANVFLSRHYYRGPAGKGSIGDMLSGDPAFYDEAAAIVRAGDAVNLPFRLTEANSYYFGGQDGVSNVFASALWGADYMLALAARGVAGVHFHGGTLESVEASLGHEAKVAKGGDLTARRNAVSSRYSAIAGDAELGFQPRPLYHGMRLAQRFAGMRMLPGKLVTGGVNATAYAARQGRDMQVALINKDAARDVVVDVCRIPPSAKGELERLHAPSLDSRRGVALVQAGTATSDADGRARLVVPRGSAVLARWRG